MPMRLERKHLGSRCHQHVMLIEQCQHRLVQRRPIDRRAMHIDRAEPKVSLDFPDRLRLELRPPDRVGMVTGQHAADAELAQRGPGRPAALAREIQNRRRHPAPQPFKQMEPALAHAQDARRHRQVRPDAAEPADAKPAHLDFQRERIGIGTLAVQRQRRACIAARLNGEQTRQILRTARHRPLGAKLLKETVKGRNRRHSAKGRSQSVDIVEGRRIAQRPSHVAAVGHRQHAQGQCNGRSATAATCSAGVVIGIERGAKDRVVGVRTQSELGRIGLADDDGASLLHALHEKCIEVRHVVFEKRRTACGGEATHCAQVFYRQGKAVHPAAPLATTQLCVALIGLLQQVVAVLQRDQRIEAGIEDADAFERVLHQLAT